VAPAPPPRIPPQPSDGNDSFKQLPAVPPRDKKPLPTLPPIPAPRQSIMEGEESMIDYFLDEQGLLSHMDGWLNKQSSKTNKKFMKRWFQIRDEQLLYYRTQVPRGSSAKEHPPAGVISLRDATSIGTNQYIVFITSMQVLSAEYGDLCLKSKCQIVVIFWKLNQKMIFLTGIRLSTKYKTRLRTGML
jgi:hypothetical protein